MSDEKFAIDAYLRGARDKYTYFLLATSASAIAFAITQTKTLTLSYSQIPLALSVIFWGISFYCGCKCALFTQELNQDSAYMYETDGAMKDMPETKDKVDELLSDSYSKNLDLVAKYSTKQFHYLVTGGLLFIVWHIIEMVIRTIKIT